MLVVGAEPVEDRGVHLGQEHVDGDRVGVGVDAELVGDLGEHDVRRVVGVRRHLHRQLAAGPERRPPPGQHRVVVGHPVQRGVGEDDVGGAGLVPRRRGRRARSAASSTDRRLVEHRRGASRCRASTPRRAARGRRAVSRPSPHPRSTTAGRSTGSSSASRSWNGWSRSACEAVVLRRVPAVAGGRHAAPRARMMLSARAGPEPLDLLGAERVGALEVDRRAVGLVDRAPHRARRARGRRGRGPRCGRPRRSRRRWRGRRTSAAAGPAS